jgi:hypothetical protein
MAAEFDATEFVDEDFERSRKNPFQAPAPMTPAPDEPPRAPTREEVDSKLTELQTKLAELKREQSEVERERTACEETRRRQLEFTTGREELVRELSRGIQLLEETEFATRREAEQMAKALNDLRESLTKLQAIQESAWTKENFSAELSRALGAADHARMEWNTARLKFAVLAGPAAVGPANTEAEKPPAAVLPAGRFLDMARVGLAYTWPIALAGLAIFLVLLFKR